MLSTLTLLGDTRPLEPHGPTIIHAHRRSFPALGLHPLRQVHHRRRPAFRAPLVTPRAALRVALRSAGLRGAAAALLMRGIARSASSRLSKPITVVWRLPLTWARRKSM